MKSMIKMVEDIQCPGCVCGSNTKCGSFDLKEIDPGVWTCEGHVLGTVISRIGKVILGCPKGFNRIGPVEQKTYVRLIDYILLKEHIIKHWGEPWNVAVWKVQFKGYIFVRTFLPRKNVCFIDVIEDAPGMYAMIPGIDMNGKEID